MADDVDAIVDALMVRFGGEACNMPLAGTATAITACAKALSEARGLPIGARRALAVRANRLLPDGESWLVVGITIGMAYALLTEDQASSATKIL